jgi:hypothetical protein
MKTPIFKGAMVVVILETAVVPGETAVLAVVAGVVVVRVGILVAAVQVEISANNLAPHLHKVRAEVEAEAMVVEVVEVLVY